MNDLEFQNVSKIYRIRHEPPQKNGLLERFRSKAFAQFELFEALRNVSFSVPSGEALGIVGHNGAGKSTVLKIISGITAPTSGTVTLRGRLAALLEVGSGFHPELTGRENIFLSGSILGMTRSEIVRKFDSIVEFAEVAKFVDTPVKRYSSGMYVRLGFAIAAYLDPEILLLDEVLAVGDTNFQKKCLDRIQAMRRGGTTIVFISHDLAAVERLCDRVILLARGEIVSDGHPADVIAQYRQGVGAALSTHSNLVGTIGRAPARVENVTVAGDPEGIRTGSLLIIRLEYTCFEVLKKVCFAAAIYSGDGRLQCEFVSSSSLDSITVEPGTGSVEFCCEHLPLMPGPYHVDALITTEVEAEPVHWFRNAVTLYVGDGAATRGAIFAQHTCRVLQNQAS